MSLIDSMTSEGNENHPDDSGYKSSSIEAKLAKISAKLLQLQEKANRSYLEQGRLLLEAKSLFGKHGEWLGWLKKNFPGSVRQAQRLMQVAEWFGKTTPESHLDFTKVYILTRIPKPKMEDFLKRCRLTISDSKPLSVIQNMSKLDLEKAIREYLESISTTPHTDKEKKAEVNSSAPSSEENALDMLCHLETAMANLVENVINQKVGDETYDTLISSQRRIPAVRHTAILNFLVWLFPGTPHVDVPVCYTSIESDYHQTYNCPFSPLLSSLVSHFALPTIIQTFKRRESLWLAFILMPASSAGGMANPLQSLQHTSVARNYATCMTV